MSFTGRPVQWGGEPLVTAITQALQAAGEPMVTDEELRRLQQEGLLDLADQGELSATHLADSIRAWRAEATADTNAMGGVTAPHVTSETLQPLMLPTSGALPDDPAVARRYAVSRVLTAELAGDATVWERITRFRRTALGARLLAWEAVERWVTDQHDREGQPGYWLSGVPIATEQVARGMETAPAGYTTLSLTMTVPLPPPWRAPARDAGDGELAQLEPRFLEYLAPGRPNPAWTFVAVGGVLEDLRQLANVLASEAVRPWWSAAQAATFVLTGLAPYVAVYKGVAYVIDPLLPLNQIVEQVAQLRRGLVGERAREMGPKSLSLAVFASERPEEPWDTRRGVWNETYPQWEYPEKQKSNFIRDSLAAKRRLLLQERQ